MKLVFLLHRVTETSNNIELSRLPRVHFILFLEALLEKHYPGISVIIAFSVKCRCKANEIFPTIKGVNLLFEGTQDIQVEKGRERERRRESAEICFNLALHKHQRKSVLVCE